MKKTLFFSLMFVLLFNGFYNVSATEVWGVEENDSLHYWLKKNEKGDEDIELLDGYMKVIVENLAGGDLDITVETEFSGSEAIDYRDSLEQEDISYTGDRVVLPIGLLVFPLFSENIVVLYTEDALYNAGTEWDNLLDAVESFGAMDAYINFSRDISETGYTFDYSYNKTQFVIKRVIEYTETGVLKYLHMEYTANEVTTTMEVKKKLVPLAYPDWYGYVAAGAVVLLIALVTICCCSRKKKN